MVYNTKVVTETNLIQTLKELIAIPSVSADSVACHQAVAYMEAAFTQHGFYIRSDADRPNPWILATSRDTLQPDIVLAAHLDVVPAPDELFTVKEEDGKLYGRGVYDMKFAAACYLELLRNHAEELKKLNIGFLFTTDEEDGGFSVLDILKAGFHANAVLIPDGGDNWHVEARAKGLLGIELTAEGKAAHGSRPWEGDNALHRIMDITNTLRREFPHRERSDSTLSITGIHGGEAVNQIPASASALIDFRSYDAEEIARMRQRLEQLAAEYGATILIRTEGNPVAFDRERPSVQSFLSALQDITGEPIAYLDAYGGSDARHFAQGDIPCIIASPRGGDRHADTEWINADDLQRYYELLEHWLLPNVNDPDEETDRALAATN